MTAMIASAAQPNRGFTMLDLLMAMACLLLIAFLTLPYLARRRHAGCKINCVNNLKQVGLCFRTWALDNNDQYPMQVSIEHGGTRELAGTGSVYKHFQVMSNELSTPRILFCPEENDRRRTPATTFATIGPVGYPPPIPLTDDSHLSYFVGVEAVSTSPSLLLTGDSNLRVAGAIVQRQMISITTNTAIEWAKPRHGKGGNIAFADGSVQTVNNKLLRQIVANAVKPNRLDLP